MRARRIVLAVILLGLIACPTFAESTSSATVTFDGKTVTYKVTGDKSASASASAKNGVYTLAATVDGIKHEVEATDQFLKWNKEKLKLAGFKKIEIVINRQSVEIKVDGKKKLPKEEKQ